MYQIVVSPNKILLQKAKEVKSFDKKLKKILTGMEETLLATYDPVGVGLAAPQVNVSLRIFLMKPDEKSKVNYFINPRIINLSKTEAVPSFTNSDKVESKKPEATRDKLLEGCLSLPNIWGNVARSTSVTIAWQDENGKIQQKEFGGFEAVIIQHEIDHLDGVLFTKHVMDQEEKLYKSHKNEKGEDEFEELKI
jgi:peptide deformylase